MKRFLIGLLAVGLVVALSMPAIALDVKISGTTEVAGYWESNRAMAGDQEAAMKYWTTWTRIEPVFKIAEGLSLVTRFEGMERVAGLAAVGSEAANGTRNSANEQNFAMKRGYISAKILGGTWDVGYMAGGNWGTEFQDYQNDVFRVKATYVIGPVIILALTEKGIENSLGATTYSSSDYDKYALAGIYKWQGGEAGYLQYYLPNNTRENVGPNPYRTSILLGAPYFKATFGPIYAEGELIYTWGKKYDYILAADQGNNVDYKSLCWYLKAKYNMGPAYIGGQVAVVSGDDPATTDKDEGSILVNASQGYSLWQPVLVLWNDWTSRFTGKGYGTYGTAGTGGLPQNVNLYQIFGGFKPMAKVSLDAAFTVMKANQRPTGFVSDDYGREFDISAAYKFYDNLTYTLAFGYLWSGDYWKGNLDTNAIGNDWLLMHKLTLTF